MRLALATLGCKLNHYETWELIRDYKNLNIVPFAAAADVYLINTCTVTQHSDFRSRQLIRQAKKRNPTAKIVVAGCYARLRKEELAALGVDLIITPENKEQLTPILNGISPASENVLKPSFLAEYTRAMVKIQDGCDHQCSYCVVRLARGRQKSVARETVLTEIKQFLAAGYQEIVLTGIQLGGYGADLSPALNLASLLREISQIEGLNRLRLSSIEPMDFTSELLDVLVETPSICQHFHIPLQSGDDEILAAMNRGYTVAEFKRLIWQLKKRFPNMGLGTDVIVGFPGETDSQFLNTYQLIAELPFSYLQVFNFSARPQTPAADLPNRIKPEIIQTRSQKLRDLGQKKKQEFQNAFVGQTLSVLIERKRDIKTGRLKGFSGNYLKIYTENEDIYQRKICNIHIEKVLDNKMLGSIV